MAEIQVRIEKLKFQSNKNRKIFLHEKYFQLLF